jgi:serine/threonine protein kinase
MVKRHSKELTDVSLVMIDFGFATKCKAGHKLTQPLGSLLYMAPELVMN